MQKYDTHHLYLYLRGGLRPALRPSINCDPMHNSDITITIYFLIFSPFHFSLSFIGFTYFLLFSIPSLSTRIVPLRFQAGGRRRRPNLGLACFVCVICIP